jgi:hypothetical protein
MTVFLVPSSTRRPFRTDVQCWRPPRSLGSPHSDVSALPADPVVDETSSNAEWRGNVG